MNNYESFYLNPKLFFSKRAINKQNFFDIHNAILKKSNDFHLCNAVKDSEYLCLKYLELVIIMVFCSECEHNCRQFSVVPIFVRKCIDFHVELVRCFLIDDLDLYLDD